jgi:hypothetical protein
MNMGILKLLVFKVNRIDGVIGRIVPVWNLFTRTRQSVKAGRNL